MWAKTVLMAALLSIAGGCGSPTTDPAGSGGPTTLTPPAEGCSPTPVDQPEMPESIPGYTEVDPLTGLHMTGTPFLVDLAGWRLEVTGRVARPLSLTYDEIRCLSRVEAAPDLVCPGFFVDRATWAGVPLDEVLSLAGMPEGAAALRLVSADGYSLRVALTADILETGFLAYELNGEVMPVLHGFPLRAVFPGEQGNTWVKWLVAIEVE